MGSKIDRLITTNQKLWELVDWHRSISSIEDIADAPATVHKLQSMIELNSKRNQLVKEIDECLDSLVKS